MHIVFVVPIFFLLRVVGAATPTVSIQNGTIQGVYSHTYHQDFFLGIPYVKPPVGAGRFNLPQPITEKWDATLQATQYGDFCYNNPNTSYSQSEDCLTLNIIRPAGTVDHDRLPILFWIHGGGYQQGGSGDGRFNMSFIVQNSVQMQQPIIMVSANYRLNGWGFISGRQILDAGLANLGLHDQRAALAWVQENIADFGGDPRRVTVQGESAGADSVGSHILAYNGRDDGLFHAAIAQSGGPLHYSSFHTKNQQQSRLQDVLDRTTCQNAPDTINCLRSVPADVLRSAFDAAAAAAQLRWEPVVDGSLIAELSSTALKSGKFVKVPLLIGTNTDEAKLYVGSDFNTDQDFVTMVRTSSYGHPRSNESVRLVVDEYPLDIDGNKTYGQPYGAQFGRAARYLGDSTFSAGRRLVCRVWAKKGLPIFSYRFNTSPAVVDPMTLPKPDYYPAGFDVNTMGPTHYQEVAFVFDNVLGTGRAYSAFDVEPGKRRKQYLEIGKLMSRMWISFVNTASPNYHGVSNFKTIWPQYSLDNPRNIVFDGNKTSYIESDTWRVPQLDMLIDRAADWNR